MFSKITGFPLKHCGNDGKYVTRVKNSIKKGKIFLHFVFLFVIFAFSFSGCGYTLHTRASLPFEAVTIGTIENKTFEPKLEDKFNQSLAETLEQYGFSVRSSARYRIEGEIKTFQLLPMTEVNLVATQYQVVMKASFRLIDTETGKVTPLAADSPFITYFGATGALESIMAQKELSTVSAMANMTQALVRLIVYNVPKVK